MTYFNLINNFDALSIELQKAWESVQDKSTLIDQATKGETKKLHPIRLANGFFDQYAPDHLSGIDIGCGFCPVNETFRRFDILYGDGNADTMDEVSNNKFHTVHACHLLEHISQPDIAIKNWFRILKPQGHLVVVVPHRDLYEKSKTLPSKYNQDHKWFWLPDKTEPPHTLGLKQLVEKNLANFEIVSLKTYDDGYQGNGDDHPSGNYSIEIVVKKL
jgi:SAM-dependent methyltransferase